MKRQSTRKTRQKRIKATIKRGSNRLRLSVFRSNKHVFAQIINDAKGITLVSAGDLKSSRSKRSKSKKTESAKKVGLELAKVAKLKEIEYVAFDRGGYKYQGRVRALAEGAREGGLKF